MHIDGRPCRAAIDKICIHYTQFSAAIFVLHHHISSRCRLYLSQRDEEIEKNNFRCMRLRTFSSCVIFIAMANNKNKSCLLPISNGTDSKKTWRYHRNQFKTPEKQFYDSFLFTFILHYRKELINVPITMYKFYYLRCDASKYARVMMQGGSFFSFLHIKDDDNLPPALHAMREFHKQHCIALRTTPPSSLINLTLAVSLIFRGQMIC